MVFTLTKSKALTEAAADCGGWSLIVPGQHHTVALDAAGRVHALGRVEYGRLGLGKQREADAVEPVQVSISFNPIILIVQMLMSFPFLRAGFRTIRKSEMC